MRESLEQQLFFMRWAIQLGEKGRCTAPPNPWVGCVIVKDGEILGEGYHEAPGKQHAEAVAIEKAGSLAKGATAYISLEPCSHQGRTPPCVNLLIASGIKKVVIPFLDPDPLVSGKGVEKLKEAGIEIIVGVGREEASSSLAPYLFQRSQKRPFCVLKCALSLDGRLAAKDGSSQWITGDKARVDVQFLRAQSQAIMIGSETALNDLPRLTVRDVPITRQPLRILLDSRGRVPPKGPLSDCALAPTLIFTCSSSQKTLWEQCGAEVILKEKIELHEVLADLGKRQIIQLLVEGGSRVHTSFLKGNFVNRLVLYYGNCILGGHGKPFAPEFSFDTMDAAPRFDLTNVQRFDNTVRLDFLPGLKSH